MKYRIQIPINMEYKVKNIKNINDALIHQLSPKVMSISQ